MFETIGEGLDWSFSILTTLIEKLNYIISNNVIVSCIILPICVGVYGMWLYDKIKKGEVWIHIINLLAYVTLVLDDFSLLGIVFYPFIKTGLLFFILGLIVTFSLIIILNWFIIYCKNEIIDDIIEQ